MWSVCVGVCQLLNWKMHGETLKFVLLLECFSILSPVSWFLGNKLKIVIINWSEQIYYVVHI